MFAKRIVIRDSVVSDVAELTLLINELGYYTLESEMKERYEIISTNPDYKTIVAVIGTEVVGMAGLCKGMFYEKNGMYMRILAFVVKQTWRNHGVGKILLVASEKWAIEQGLNMILLNSGNRDERNDAHAFYKEMGYTVKSSGYVKQL